MDYLLATKLRYYAEDNSDIIINKVLEKTSHRITSCRHELICILNDILDTEPCCYWNTEVFEATKKNLQLLVAEKKRIAIDENILELFLIGYSTYIQTTKIINDLSGINDSPAMKNRQYRIPTYISVVEGCLTNLYRFIALLINQISEKDYASQNKLSSLIGILNKNGFKELTESVDINIRNAINHGGILFKEDGKIIDFHYTENGRSTSCSLEAYRFDQLINDVYDTASGIILASALFLNDNWNLLQIDSSKKTFVAFSLLCMELSIPSVRCRYISEASNVNQLNAEFWISNTERTYIIQTAIELSMLIYSQYNDYDQYLISFSSERLAASWLRFTNQEVYDMLNKTREFSDVLNDVIQKKEINIWDPATEPIDLQEIKYFRFPNYQCDTYKINQIEDVSLPDRKRFRCRLYIGEVSEKTEIIEILRNSIEWLKTIRNVDSPTIHHKNGNMEADSLYITVYRYDARKNKELYPNNENFVCFADYNLTGSTTLENGGLPDWVWNQFHHEKIGKISIAWREGKYMMRRFVKIGANDLCPCGSGKKYKRCCRGKGIYD